MNRKNVIHKQFLIAMWFLSSFAIASQISSFPEIYREKRHNEPIWTYRWVALGRTLHSQMLTKSSGTMLRRYQKSILEVLVETAPFPHSYPDNLTTRQLSSHTQNVLGGTPCLHCHIQVQKP